MAGRRHRGRRRGRRARTGGGHPAEEDELSALPRRRTGRRPGNPDTREAVLAAARTAFADRGYDGASIRAIASDAGVDPALVHHYFGTKDELFIAAVQAPVDPEELLPAVLAGGPENLGANAVRTVVTAWDGPVGAGGLALIRSAVANEWTARLMREFLLAKVIRRIVGSLGHEPAERDARGALVASQMIGTIMARYVLRIEPVASATPDELAAAIGPTIQRYLTGDVELPEAASAAPGRAGGSARRAGRSSPR